jgi:hypothetical protein
MSENETVEQEIQRKGLTAPRVTPAAIEANIASEHYFTAEDGVGGRLGREQREREGITLDDAEKGMHVPVVVVDVPLSLHLLTFCVLVLRNGFTVHGVSACASPENFNAELGKRIARENAVREMWPLMGYALREKLAGGEA